MRLLLLLLLATFTSVAIGQNRRSLGGAFMHASPLGHNGEGMRGGGPPANDDCTDAQSVSVAADCSAPIDGNNAEATDDGPDATCDDPGSELLDVWYSFNSGAESAVWITLTPSADMTDHAFVVYDGCAGTEIFCLVTPAAPAEVTVAPNTDYWVRVHSNLDYGVGGAFTLCISTEVNIDPPPPNDLCTGATPQSLAIGDTVTYNGDNSGATDSEGLGFNSAWEAFTIDTCADVKISYCGTPSPFGTFWGVLYNGCPFTDARSVSSYDSTACSDGNFTICFPDLDAGTYYYGVAQFLGSTGPYVLNVSAAVCGSDLASNDECVNAIPIPGQADCQTSFFTNPCATQSLPAFTCGTLAGDANDDVWYSFVATAADMTIGASPRGNMDIVLELFSGSCGSSTSIGCADVTGSGAPEDLIASNLTVGTTYYFRIYDFRFQYASAEPGYDLCVVEGLGSGVGMEEGVVMSTSSSIYPNPNNGDFTVSVDPRSAYGSISIIDATGRIVLARNERNTTGTVQLLAAGKLSPGVYTVRVGAGSRTSEGRLMIQ